MKREIKYWLMAYVVHSADFPYWQFHATEWSVNGEVEDKLNEGDVLYLANGEIGIYAWGYLSEKIVNESKEQSFIKISRGAIKSNIIGKNTIQQVSEIKDLLSFSDGRFTFLTNKQVKILNSLISGVSKPPLPSNQQFIINQPVEEDEGIYMEFKEINVNKIPDVAYEYAQSFLNQDGGRIYFGIRNKDKKVAGITVPYSKRDEIQQKIENKLYSIIPPVKPFEHYTFEFHPIIDEQGNQIPEKYIFELEVKPNASKDFKSASGKHSIKTFSGKRKD